jgi:hypothetical protein
MISDQRLISLEIVTACQGVRREVAALKMDRADVVQPAVSLPAATIAAAVTFTKEVGIGLGE